MRGRCLERDLTTRANGEWVRDEDGRARDASIPGRGVGERAPQPELSRGEEGGERAFLPRTRARRQEPLDDRGDLRVPNDGQVIRVGEDAEARVRKPSVHGHPVLREHDVPIDQEDRDRGVNPPELLGRPAPELGHAPHRLREEGRELSGAGCGGEVGLPEISGHLIDRGTTEPFPEGWIWIAMWPPLL